MGWNGINETDDREDKINELLERLSLPQQKSNRGYNPVHLINNFWVSIWNRPSRFEHLVVTRMDKVMQKIFGWKQMAGNKSFQRYFKKFGQGDNQRVFDGMFNTKNGNERILKLSIAIKRQNWFE
ncbi:MAG: hypothetical protein NTX22_01010 [Ignavibacteriales bacterium]|nr:hypothetical protein [Ignavibacteriales bacterium]